MSVRILAYLLVLRPRWRGAGGGGLRGYLTNVYMLIRGGSAPRSNSLHFYKPFFYVKGNPFIYLLLTNGISFTDLISNFASLLTSHQASQQTNSGHVCDQPGLPVPEALFVFCLFFFSIFFNSLLPNYVPLCNFISVI